MTTKLKINKYMGDSAFWAAAMKLALPIAFQNLLMSSFSLVDTLMIGQLGDIPLSSVGMAGQWTWLMGLVMFGLSSGSAVFISQYWGIGDRKRINGIYGIMLIHTLLVGVLFTLIGFFIPELVVGLFNKEQAVIATGASYLKIACLAYIGQAVNITVSTLLRSTENVRLPMFSGLISSLMNVVLNYGLIYGRFGLPEMGVRGAALATVISTWSAPIFMIAVSLYTKNIVCAPLKEMFGFGRAVLFNFYKISLPVILNESLWGLGTVCYNIVFGNLGYEYYAAVTIYRTIEGVFFVFFIGMCTACCVMTGKAIGAGRIVEAKRDGTRFLVVMILMAMVVGLLIILLRGPLVAIFNTSGNITRTTVDAALGILTIYGAELALRQIPYIIIVGLFRPGGDTATGMKYDLLFVWLFSLPLTVISAFVLKLPFVAVFAVMLFAEDTIKSVFCIKRLVSGKWVKPLTEQGRKAM